MLCAALVRDAAKRLPRRKEIVDAIGRAIRILNNLRGVSKMGESTWTILTRLVSRLSLPPEERLILTMRDSLSHFLRRKHPVDIVSHWESQGQVPKRVRWRWESRLDL